MRRFDWGIGRWLDVTLWIKRFMKRVDSGQVCFSRSNCTTALSALPCTHRI